MKKVIDERGRLFGKISVIDIVVILAVIVMVAAYFVRSNSGGGDAGASSLTEVTYRMEIREVRQSTADLIREGDTVYDEHGVNLGVVESVSVTHAEITAPIADGSYVEATSEGRLDVEMTLKAQCALADGHVFADRRTELAIGAQLPILTKYVKTTATVTEIE